MGPITLKRGVAEAPYADVAAVKSAFTRHLSPHASARLMDPNFGYPSGVGEMPPAIGLAAQYSAG